MTEYGFEVQCSVIHCDSKKTPTHTFVHVCMEQLLKFRHYYLQWQSCYEMALKDPTTPKTCCYTTAWNTHTQSFYCSSGICPGLPRWAGTRKVKTRKVKPIWIYWSKRWWVAVASAGPYAKSAPHPRQPRQHPTTQFFTGRVPFLPPNQQRQSTEGKW